MADGRMLGRLMRVRSRGAQIVEILALPDGRMLGRLMRVRSRGAQIVEIVPRARDSVQMRKVLRGGG